MNGFRLATLLSLCFQLLGSGAFASPDSIAEPLVKWSKPEVRVCWYAGDRGFTEEEKQAVQKIVQQEYTPKKTGIYFTGWKNCADIMWDNYDVSLLEDTDDKPYKIAFDGQSSAIGENGILEKETRWSSRQSKMVDHEFYRTKDTSKLPNVYLVAQRKAQFKISYLVDLERTALHELGHIAGLRHEHARPEAQLDPHCKGVSLTEKEIDTTDRYGEYDNHSIMNYCWKYYLEDNGGPEAEIGLSDGDRHTLQCLYLPASESNQCNPIPSLPVE